MQTVDSIIAADGRTGSGSAALIRPPRPSARRAAPGPPLRPVMNDPGPFDYGLGRFVVRSIFYVPYPIRHGVTMRCGCGWLLILRLSFGPCRHARGHGPASETQKMSEPTTTQRILKFNLVRTRAQNWELCQGGRGAWIDREPHCFKIWALIHSSRDWGAFLCSVLDVLASSPTERLASPFSTNTGHARACLGRARRTQIRPFLIDQCSIKSRVGRGSRPPRPEPFSVESTNRLTNRSIRPDAPRRLQGCGRRVLPPSHECAAPVDSVVNLCSNSTN